MLTHSILTHQDQIPLYKVLERKLEILNEYVQVGITNMQLLFSAYVHVPGAVLLSYMLHVLLLRFPVK